MILILFLSVHFVAQKVYNPRYIYVVPQIIGYKNLHIKQIINSALGCFGQSGLQRKKNPNCHKQKYSRLRCVLRVKGLVICFYLGWSGSTLQFRQNIIKVGSKSWLLTCSSNITSSLPSYTGSALKRELNFCYGYLSLLYICAISNKYATFEVSFFYVFMVKKLFTMF